MRNPIRRNKNIGTAKQGFKRNNKMVIPFLRHSTKFFDENLTEYTKVRRCINGVNFLFVVEKTRPDYYHACTIEDLEVILRNVLVKDLGDLTTIILRQPKRKEEILSPVWGRLVYGYEFENVIQPAIILEAQSYQRSLVWKRNLHVDAQRELERLRHDGHKIEENRREFRIYPEPDKVRATQLYRTLLHEIGHYVQYNQTGDEYVYIPKNEREAFAHRYADKMSKILQESRQIPFDRIVDFEALTRDNLQISDFIDGYKDFLYKKFDAFDKPVDDSEKLILRNAVEVILKAIPSQQLDAEDYYLWGYLYYFSDGDRPTLRKVAKGKFEQSLAIDSDYYRSRLYLAHCLHDERELDDALQEYERVDQETLRQEFPIWRYVKLREQIGYCYYQLGFPTKGEAYFEEVLEYYRTIDDQLAVPHELLSCLHKNHPIVIALCNIGSFKHDNFKAKPS
ncbi:hypothetical protein QNI19_29765 [Cytophagaceae bacterium DM2B3-1]|uniref:Tetratricopeptide repeat protein n=1 Tax=Xanthocytophaga flava TaxID=3048013 RepID=A0ABT7CTR2_9BACT|nr:hypothetical protein [Xanthocytophaga flavus]MDJ1497163.1 hypothetical protein [Xanthocytophaga flavus]